MKINIIIFGQLCDLMGQNLVLYDIADTNSLVAVLNEKFPGLINSKYMLAVNKKAIMSNTTLTNNCIVAMLPPFSGG